MVVSTTLMCKERCLSKYLTSMMGLSKFSPLIYHKLDHMQQGTVVEGTIQQLFEGHHMNYIECINVDYKSTRKESFYGMLTLLIIRRNLGRYKWSKTMAMYSFRNFILCYYYFDKIIYIIRSLL